MNTSAIQVNGLSKKYSIRPSKQQSDDSLREWLMSHMRNGREDPRKETIWALRDVSFSVAEGEVVGVIGRNGAGKSTLLKIMSRITEPTEGRVILNGKVGSLLEVGTGFHPELTGRENIYLSGAILGMSRQQIQQRFDEIVDFSGVEQFIETPIKRYSSGMSVRLGFAVAAHLVSEILLVDEVLSVGDVAFQKKCLGKIGDVAKDGRTVLFVSHNMTAVQALCQRVVLLDRGAIAAIGDTSDAIAKYLKVGIDLQTTELRERKDRGGNGLLRFASFEVRAEDGSPTSVVQSGQTIQLAVSFKLAREEVSRIKVTIVVLDAHGRFLFACNNEASGDDLGEIVENGAFVCEIQNLPLPPGNYPVNLQCVASGRVADHVLDAGYIQVEPGDFFESGYLPDFGRGGIFVRNHWRFENES